MEAKLRRVLEAACPGEEARYSVPGLSRRQDSLRRCAWCAVGRLAEAGWHCRDDAGRDHSLAARHNAILTDDTPHIWEWFNLVDRL